MPGISQHTDMSPRRAAGNVALLGLAQALSTCAPIVVTLLGGIVGTRLAPEGWSTLPMSVMIITLATGAIPASMLMRRIGRRAGFAGGGLLGAIGALVVALAPKSNSIMGFFKALKDVRDARTGEVPNHLKDGTRDKEGFGHGEGYQYPHAFKHHWVAQQYLPAGLHGHVYYAASTEGYEGAQAQVLARFPPEGHC